MKPLYILLGAFIAGILARQAFPQKLTLQNLGSYAMSAMLLTTGIAHFVYPDGMEAMLPEWVPARGFLVLSTGVLELLGAVGLVFERSRRWTGIALIIFLIAVLPANIYAALNHIDPLTGMDNGPGPQYLYFRVPLQLFFIVWIYLSAVRRNPEAK